jgi:hypothetical protein
MQEDAAFIKPFTREVLFSLGAVQYAFSHNKDTEFAKGQRLLNVVQKAVLRVGSFYSFMVGGKPRRMYAGKHSQMQLGRFAAADVQQQRCPRGRFCSL